MTVSYTLKDKRLLTMREFQAYSNIGRNNAFRLVHELGCGIRIGNKILVDREAFDAWCDAQATRGII